MGRFLTDVRALARTTTSTSGMMKALSTMDHRIAGIELIGWPALADSLRNEMTEAVAIAQSRGLKVSAPVHTPPPENPLARRWLTCGVCSLRIERTGSRQVRRDGVVKQVCAPCAQKATR